MVDRSIARPVFIISQWSWAFFNHVMFQFLLGPLWTIVLMIKFGYVYVQNYGFVPGSFNLACAIQHVVYGCVVAETYLLIKDELDYKRE